MSVDFTGYRQLAPMSDADLNEVMAHLDQILRPSDAAAKRGSDRPAYRVGQVRLSVLHPGGGAGRYLVYTRDLTARGMGVLHGGFLYPKTACEVVLTTILGDSRVIKGKIAWCRHIMGKLHGVGIEFNEQIEPRSFVDPCLGGGNSAVDVKPGKARGTILHIDPEAMDRELLRMQFTETPVSILNAATKEEAVGIVENSPIDVVMCELQLGKDTGEAVMQSLRDAGYVGPLLAVTGENNPDRLKKLPSAGATAIFIKPYDPAKLIRQVIDHLSKVEFPVSDVPIYSALEGAIASREPVVKFIDLVTQKRQTLKQAMQAGDTSTVRAICQSVQSSGKGFGFQVLGEAAKAALRRLDATLSVKESRDALLRLDMIMGRLRSRTSENTPTTRKPAA